MAEPSPSRETAAVIFTPRQRDATLAWVLHRGEEDLRLEAGVVTGSMGSGTADRWSDIDVAFVVDDSESSDLVATDWVAGLSRELAVAHHYATAFGPTLVRGFLLDNGLEVDLSFTPSADFAVWAPVRVSFDRTGRATRAAESAQPWTPTPAWSDQAGYAWHDVVHACVAVNRHKPWRALFYLQRVRNRTLTLASERHGHDASEFVHVDALPAAERDPLLATLVDRLEPETLLGAIDAATRAFLDELARGEPTLAARLKQPLMAVVRAAQEEEG